MKNRSFLSVIALLFIGAVFGAVLVSNFGLVKPAYAERQIGGDKPVVSPGSMDLMSFNKAFVEVAEQVTPSIVQIRVVSTVKTKAEDPFRFFFRFRDDAPHNQQSGGSGVIISKDGYILTNNHVVENANSVEVTLFDKRAFEAQVIGTDPLTDLAVIKIDAEDLPAAYLGESDKLKVGEWVMAIGNPLSLSSTVTAGIISAKGRSLEIIEDRAGVENFLQTDAAINPGNSGGALVNLEGAVIGINTAIATNGMSSSYIGYGFAIPIDLAKSVAEDLIANGKVSRGYIGVSITEVNAATAKAIGLDKPTGVMVQDVLPDGAAAKADIQPGDVILKIDGKVVNMPNELQSAVARKRAGNKVNLEVFRDGDKLDKVVELKAPDKEDEEPATVVKRDKKKSKDEIAVKQFSDIGFTLREMTDNDYKTYEVETGILIKSVENYSKAYNQRLIAGLVITEVKNDNNKINVNSIEEFEKIVEDSKGSAILLKVKDIQGNTRFVGLEIPD